MLEDPGALLVSQKAVTSTRQVMYLVKSQRQSLREWAVPLELLDRWALEELSRPLS